MIFSYLLTLSSLVTSYYESTRDADGATLHDYYKTPVGFQVLMDKSKEDITAIANYDSEIKEMILNIADGLENGPEIVNTEN